MSAVRLVSTKDLSRDDWLAWRQKGIGSSDAAAAIGISPYKSPLALWLEKTGRQAPEDLSAKEAVFWGTTLEPLLAEVYAQRTGNKVRRVNQILQHPKEPYMLANLDRAIEGGGILEIKTAGLRSERQWEDGVPFSYQIQVLHQLAVTGKAWADVAVLLGGQEFRIYRVERDETRIDALIDRECRFWRYVTEDTPPPVDGSESSRKALAALYPCDQAPLVDYSDQPEPNTLFAHLVAARKDRQACEQKEALLEQQVKEIIADAQGALFEGGQALWKQTKASHRLDVDKLTQDHPELVAAYTREKPGPRRFTIQEGVIS
jgi:putative phage-type endonuclease